jgi:copper(I)-binding protein
MTFKSMITSIAVVACLSASVGVAEGIRKVDDPIVSPLTPQSEAAFIQVLNAWARPSISSTNNNSAIYFEIQNNSNKDYNLINVASDIANKVELHQSFIDEKGVAKMVKLDKLVIPATSSVTLQPGGIHIMLLDLKSKLKVGEKFSLSLYFDNGIQQNVEVEVKTTN